MAAGNPGRLSAMDEEARIERDLDDLARRHYYSEDYEVAAALEAYVEGLSPIEVDCLHRRIRARLADDPSLLHAIYAATLRVEGAECLLAEALDRETQVSQRSRVLMQALARFPCDRAYRAIERFVDSDQEIDALQILARMDFPRTLPLLRRALEVEHLRPVCLHAFRDRARDAGLVQLIEDLRKAAGPDREAFRRSVDCCLDAKSGAYHPLAPQEVRAIREALR